MLAQPSAETISLNQANGWLINQLGASSVKRSFAVGSFGGLDLAIGGKLADLPDTERMIITLEDEISGGMGNPLWVCENLEDYTYLPFQQAKLER